MSLQERDSNIQLEYVEETDYYRPGRPYVLLHSLDRSKVNISINYYHGGSTFVDGSETLVVNLNHCSTTKHGIVDFLINGTLVKSAYMAPIWDFGTEEFRFAYGPHLKPGPRINRLTIQLSDGSPGVYWLSDVTLWMEGDTPPGRSF